jgi:hypothetical protein
MSTAVLIYGQARTFRECYASQRWQIYRKLEDPHFFVSVEDDEQAGDMDLLRRDFANVHIQHVKAPTLPEPAQTNADAAPYANSVPIQHILKQFWHASECWRFFVSVTPKTSFASFLRIRPDSRVILWESPSAIAPGVWVPWWGNYGGAADRMAFIQGSMTAHRYFTVLDDINILLAMGCPLHPESLLAAKLEQTQTPLFRTLNAEFDTIRLPGDGRPHVRPVYYAGDVFRYVRAELARSRRDA